MRNITKILIGASILLLCTGIIYATDYNQIFTAPAGLQTAGTNGFVDLEGHNIMIDEYDDEAKQTWLENDTDPEYLVQKYNDTWYIATDDDNDCYIIELVEKDNTQYLISSWTPNGPEDTKIIQGNLEEFNKINQLTPLTIEE